MGEDVEEAEERDGEGVVCGAARYNDHFSGLLPHTMSVWGFESSVFS